MAKSKQAPALFEVIGDKKEVSASGKFTLPKWWRHAEKVGPEQVTGLKGASGQGNQQVAEKVPQYTGGQVQQPYLAGKAAPSRSQVRPMGLGGIADDKQPPPVLRFNAGRVELSLNTVSAVVAVGVLVLALFTSYQLGRGLRSDEPIVAQRAETADSVERALHAKPNAKVLDVQPLPRELEQTTDSRWTQPKAGIGPLETSADRTDKRGPEPASGGNSVILESFKPDHDKDAEHAQTWLAEKKNLLTTLEKTSDGRWVLKSVRRFDNRKELDEYCKMVKAFGEEYKAEFGTQVRYDFHEPYGQKE